MVSEKLSQQFYDKVVELGSGSTVPDVARALHMKPNTARYCAYLLRDAKKVTLKRVRMENHFVNQVHLVESKGKNDVTGAK